MRPTFSQKYSRTTAMGRRLWSLMATTRRLLRCLLNELNEVQVHMAHVPKPDITPSIEASKSLLQALGNRPLPVLNDMEWNYGRAVYLRHLASALYRQLGALHELDCM